MLFKFHHIQEQISKGCYSLTGIGFDTFKEHCRIAIQNEHPGLNTAIYDSILDRAFNEFCEHFIDVQGTVALTTILKIIKHYSKFASTIINLYNEFYY